MRKLLLLSTSVLQNGKYLDYASDVIKAFFAEYSPDPSIKFSVLILLQ